jgi:hypothetical protein
MNIEDIIFDRIKNESPDLRTIQNADIKILCSFLKETKEAHVSAVAAIGHLRSVVKSYVDNYERYCANDCHCEICTAKHALSATSGYEQGSR